MVSLDGVRLALRVGGPRVLLCEFLRRFLGVKYSVDGFVVRDDRVFRLWRKIRLMGGSIFVKGGFLYVDVGWSVFRAPVKGDLHLWLLGVVAEGIPDMYNYVRFDGATVLDVGGFMGVSACFFARAGARRVYAFEPVKMFYDVLIDNVRLNGFSDVVEVRNYGLWFRNACLPVSITGSDTGLRTGSSVNDCIEVHGIRDVFSEFGGDDVIVKFDCEGCEYALLSLDCGTIRRVKTYIVEIHGAYMPLVDKMRWCGYDATMIHSVNVTGAPVTVWLFTREG